jgi:hypothetical protein
LAFSSRVRRASDEINRFARCAVLVLSAWSTSSNAPQEGDACMLLTPAQVSAALELTVRKAGCLVEPTHVKLGPGQALSAPRNSLTQWR